ncbi:MAG: hypothetical protein ACLR7U_12795 [Ruthenibacterium lactatiformans]
MLGDNVSMDVEYHPDHYREGLRFAIREAAVPWSGVVTRSTVIISEKPAEAGALRKPPGVSISVACFFNDVIYLSSKGTNISLRELNKGAPYFQIKPWMLHGFFGLPRLLAEARGRTELSVFCFLRIFCLVFLGIAV